MLNTCLNRIKENDIGAILIPGPVDVLVDAKLPNGGPPRPCPQKKRRGQVGHVVPG